MRGLHRRQRRAGDVEQLNAVLVAKAAELEHVDRPLDLGHAHHRPGDHVASRCGPKCREIAPEHLGARVERVVCLGLVDRCEAAIVLPLPERRVGVVEHVPGDAGVLARRGAPGSR